MKQRDGRTGENQFMNVCHSGTGCPSLEFEDGVYVTTLAFASHTEYHITAPFAGREPAEVCEIVRRQLVARNAQAVACDVFGVSAPALRSSLESMVGNGCPVTWLTDMGTAPNGGLLVWAISGAPVETLRMDGVVVGTAFALDGARYCRLGGLVAGEITRARPEQTSRVFDQMIAGLSAADMGFEHVVRTWFYNDDILGWYGDFNKVRTGFFREHHVFDGMVPASTGIGGPNIAGAGLVAGLLAMRSDDGATRARPLASPLQCPALDYGSSFSRAAEIASPRLRRVLVSGTASIAPEGHTEHLGDVDAQTRLTMDVVHAILASRGMSWENTTRAVAYVRPGEDVTCIERYLAASDLPPLPLVVTVNTVCREDLLFELELDAAMLVTPQAK